MTSCAVGTRCLTLLSFLVASIVSNVHSIRAGSLISCCIFNSNLLNVFSCRLNSKQRVHHPGRIFNLDFSAVFDCFVVEMSSRCRSRSLISPRICKPPARQYTPMTYSQSKTACGPHRCCRRGHARKSCTFCG